MIVLFDFCDTIVDYQTADVFVSYVLKAVGRNDLYEFLHKHRKLDLFFEKHWLLRKKLHLLQLAGLKRESIDHLSESFYDDMIAPRLIAPIVSVLNKHVVNQDDVYIVSGGYFPYIYTFARKHRITGIIANEFFYINNYFIGTIKKKDCMGEEKLKRVKKVFSDSDRDKVIVYSDGISDLPLLKWGGRGIVVSKTKNREWPHNNGLDQIVASEMAGEYK